MLIVRKFQQGDEKALRAIFFNTIRNVNIKDYSEAQVEAWAPDDYDQNDWFKRIQAIAPFVAVLDKEIVGYADIQVDGYIDHFFCHWKYQGQGVGKALMQELFTKAKTNQIERLYSHVSVTAKPFFEHYGFKVVKQHEVEVRGQTLTNYVMELFLNR